RMKPHRCAKLLRKVAHFRTAQQYIEGTARPPALSCEKMLHHCFLRGCHFIPLQRFEPVTHQFNIAGTTGSLGLRCHQRENNSTNHDPCTTMHTISPSTLTQSL